MAESRLPVELNQEYRVKLGKSFTFPKENSFHTIKYDFKPKSVDPSQPGRLKVEGEEVTVSLPLFQAESFDHAAMFRGAKRPVQKECILIINKVTGEAVLERINTTVQLKSVRDGSKSKKLRSVSPLPTLKPTATNKPAPPSQQSSKPIRPLKQPKASKKPKEAKSHKVKGMGKASQSSMLAPPLPSVPNVPLSQPPSVTQQFITLPESISPLTSNNPTPEPGQLPPRSFSSSSSSSSSKSGSLSDSDDSDMEQQLGLSPQAQQAPLPPPVFIPEPTQPPLAAVPPEVGGMQSLSADSSSSCSSSSSSSGSDDDSDSSSSSSSSSGAEEEENQGQVIAGSGYTNIDASLSRPRSMSLLKEDLQLSDSDSD